MASREEWCAEQLSKLLNENLRVSTLQEIRDYLASLPHEEANRTASLLELSIIFDCLNDSKTEQIELACEVLTMCMSNLNLGQSTDRYSIPLERALKHPLPAVKIMVLKEIQRNLIKEELLVSLCRRVSLVKTIVSCIGDENLSVGKEAANVIVTFGGTDVGLRQLVSADIISHIHEVSSINEIIRLRMYEVFVNIAKLSSGSQMLLVSVGLLPQILQELDTNDVLLKLNIVELLSQLVVTEHGYKYLDSEGVMMKLFNDFEDSLIMRICEPGYLKLFGHMAHRQPRETFRKFPAIVQRLFSNVESVDLTIVGVSLDTIGHIAETNEGKYTLNATGKNILHVLNAIVVRITSLPTEVRIRALNCIESLLRVTESENEITKITNKWYSALGTNPMDMIYKHAQNPFSEIRLAGLGILNAVSSHYWGQEIIKNTPGLVEYLLDRRIETVKECKEAKYEIIVLLSASPAFDVNTQRQLHAFVKEGPFYVQAVTEVAIEGND